MVNESPLASMFQTQQTADGLQKEQKAYNVILEKGKQLGLQEVAHAEPVRRSENDTHPISAGRTRSMQQWMQQCQNEV